MEYVVLHYSGNVTGEDDVQPGRILGANELDVPWLVIDSEYDPSFREAEGHFDGDGCTFPAEGHLRPGGTTVHLRTAEPDDVRAEFRRLVQRSAEEGRLPSVFRRPVVEPGEGQVWIAPDRTPILS